MAPESGFNAGSYPTKLAESWVGAKESGATMIHLQRQAGEPRASSDRSRQWCDRGTGPGAAWVIGFQVLHTEVKSLPGQEEPNGEACKSANKTATRPPTTMSWKAAV